MAQHRQAQESHHAAVPLARHVSGARQRPLAQHQQHQRDERQRGEHQHRAGMAEALDGKAGGDQANEGPEPPGIVEPDGEEPDNQQHCTNHADCLMCPEASPPALRVPPDKHAREEMEQRP